MDTNWKRTYDALTQLRSEIKHGVEAGTRHLSDAKRFDLLRAIDAVRNDTASCERLGMILLAEKTVVRRQAQPLPPA